MADPAEKPDEGFDALYQTREKNYESDLAQEAGQAAFGRQHRSLVRPNNPLFVPTISTPEEAEALAPGRKFIGPDGQQRVVPYRVEKPEDLNDVPDGADFIGPDGELRVKPQYQGISTSAQYLYNVAHNDKGRRKALERSYPGKVRDDPSGGFFIEDDDGVLRKPGRGATQTLGGVASAAAPTALGVGGAVAGGLFGGLPGVAGAAAGGMAGAKVNDIVASLAGVYDPEGATRDMLIEGALSGGGQAAGVVAGPAVAAVKAGIQKGTRALPWLANTALGTDPAALPLAREMAERGEKPGKGWFGKIFSEPGVAVPPSQVFKEAPSIQNIVEFKESALHTQDPLQMSREAHFEKGVGELLEGAGVKKTGSALKPEAAVPVEQAGQRILEQVRAKSAESDQRLRELLELRKADVERRMALTEQRRATESASIEQAQEDAQQAAQRLIDEGFRDIDRQSNDALRVAGAGYNTGDLWRSIGEQLQGYREGIQARARTMYDTANELSGAVRNAQTGIWEGGIRPDISGLGQRAQAFLDQLPEEFAARYPSMVAKIRDMARAAAEKEEEKILSFDEAIKKIRPYDDPTVVRPPRTSKWNERTGQYDVFDDATGQLVGSAPTLSKAENLRFQAPFSAVPKDMDALISEGPTWAQLHDLRTQLRQNIQWHDLTSDVRNGTLKYFSNRINEILAESDPVAATALRRADKFYRENMGPLENRQIQAVMDGLKSGLQADPRALLDTIMKTGKTEVAEQIQRIVGENTWNAVRAADTQEMLQVSRELDGTIDSKRFAAEVLKRQQQGLLETLHGRGAQRLVDQATAIERLAGRLSVPTAPGDRINDLILRAHAAADLAKQAASADPIKALRLEMANVLKQHRAEMKAARVADPMSFMLNPTVGAHEAVNRILKDPDMIIAASRAFPGGDKSPEFELLRQIYVQRFFQQSGLRPAQALEKVTPEVQALMFPGVSLEQMKRFAKEMELLVPKGSDEGKGIMRTNIQENPTGSATGLGKLAGPLKMLPGANFAARSLLGNYYGTIREIVTSPTTLRWLEKGLSSSSPADLAAARAELKRIMRQTRAAGAGTGAALGSMHTQEPNNE